MAAIVVSERLVIPDGEISESFVRASGPGGQNVNKVATKVELRWKPGESGALDPDRRAALVRRLEGRLTTAGELIVTSSLTRDQSRNREDAMEKLAALVRAAMTRPKRRRPTRPSRGARERRLAEKKRRSARKKERRVRHDD